MNDDSIKKCVLIVEDEEDLRLVLRLTIEQMFGYRVIEAANGEMGVQLAKQEKPILILMDLVLPKMSGFEAIAAIQSDLATQHIHILVISDHCWASDVKDKVAACGITSCIDKAHLLEQIPKVITPILM